MTTHPDLTSIIDEFEAKRKACLRTWYIWLGVIAILLLGCEYWIYVSDLKGKGLYAIPPFFAIFGVVISFFFSTADFKSSYKTSIIQPIIASYQKDMTYEPDRYIEESKYSASELFHKKVERYQGEDYISGTRNGLRFELSELHTEYQTSSSSGSSSGTRRNWHTIFKGIFCIVELSEKLDLTEPVLVLPTTLENMVEQWGVTLEKAAYRRTKPVAMQDPAFEKKFWVYTDDKDAARKLLTSDLRKCILEYEQKVDNQLHLSFTESNVYIAISSFKNYFEPRIFAPLKDPKTLQAFTDELDLLMEIIDLIKN